MPKKPDAASCQRDTVTFMREAMPVATTIDEAARTFEVVWSKAGALVRRYDWWRDVAFDEELSLDPAHMRMGRLTSSAAPFGDSHKFSEGVKNVIGVVERAWIDGDEGKALIRFSKVPSLDEVWAKIREGILRCISVGYRVYKYQRTDGGEGEVEHRLAVDWEPLEISLVPIPADADALVRADPAAFAAPVIVGEPAEETRTQQPEGNDMPQPNQTGRKPGTDDATRNPPVDIPAPATEPGIRAAPPAAPITTAETVDPSAVEAAMRAERQRASDITAIGTRAGITADQIQAAIDNGTSIEAFRAATLDTLIGQQKPISTVQVNTDEGDTLRTLVENALLHRAGQNVKLEAGARQYRGMTLMELGRDFVRSAHGTAVRTGDNRRDAAIILGMAGVEGRGANSTSDFPILLANVANHTLRAAYNLRRGDWPRIASRATLNDYKSVTRIALSEAIRLLPVSEGGEYQRTTLAESGESYNLTKHGRIIPFTREALINDDLGGFTRLARQFGNGAASLEESIVLDAFLANNKMSDGVPLFDAKHGNLAATGATIDEASLDEARIAIREQKGLGDSDDPLNLEPKFLIVGPKMETAARKMLSAIVATVTGDVNVFAGSLDVLVFSRITGCDWYLSVDPNSFDTIEYAYLSGEEGLYTEERVGFEVDGLEVKGRLDFGAKAIDWRGMFKNPGAAPQAS